MGNTYAGHEEFRRYGMAKNVIHISELEAVGNLPALLARVRAGAEVIIEQDSLPIAILGAPVPVSRTISECMALLAPDSEVTIDSDFAKDVEADVESHCEPLA